MVIAVLNLGVSLAAQMTVPSPVTKALSVCRRSAETITLLRCNIEALITTFASADFRADLDAPGSIWLTQALEGAS
jgi:hypothetical protein